MKNDEFSFSMQSIRFLIMHPWVFLCPIVIIMSLVSARLSYLKLNYECKAVIAFEAAGTQQLLVEKFIQQKRDFVDSVRNILNEESMRAIAGEVWPDITEKTGPAKYAVLLMRLHGGIKFMPEMKGETVSGMALSFIDSNPVACHKVVKSALEIIKKGRKIRTEEQIETGLVFLKKQLEFYREKLKSIDEEVSRLKVELNKMYPSMSEEEKYLIDDILDTTNMKDFNVRAQAKVQQLSKYDEKLTEFKLQMLGLEKRKEVLGKRLETGESGPLALSAKDVEEDTFLKHYSQAVAEKELAMAELLSQGFTAEHPQIKQLKGEIERLKDLRDKRLEELTTSPKAFGRTRKSMEDKIKMELKELDNEIDTVKDKIASLESYKKSSEKGISPARTGIGIVSSQTSRLMELRHEKTINQTYYNDIRQQLEAAEIKSRIEKEEAGFKINVIEEPVVPKVPIPLQKEKKLVFGLIIAVSIGAGLAYLVDAMDSSVKSSSELRELLQVPVLASIDRMNTIQDIRFTRLRRNAIIIALILFALLSKLIVKPFMRFF